MRAYKLGRGVTKTVGTSPVLVTGSSVDRIAIHCSAHNGTIWVSDNQNMVAGEGICVPVDGPPTEVCTCHQGSWIGMNLFAIADTADSKLYLLEGVEPERSESISKFKHKYNPGE